MARMGRFAILLVPFLVAGCALPPAFSIASFAADGISYLATGKSTTDHALSLIAQEDCAMMRALEEKPICVPEGGAVVLVAALAEPPARRAPIHVAEDIGAGSPEIPVPVPAAVEVPSLTKSEDGGPESLKAPAPALVETASLAKADDRAVAAPKAKAPALMLVQKTFAKAPVPAPKRKPVAKDFPAKAAPSASSQLAERVWPKARAHPAIPAPVGRTVFSLCAGAPAIGPAAQCGFGPDA